jgi:hypothetical protein
MCHRLPAGGVHEADPGEAGERGPAAEVGAESTSRAYGDGSSDSPARACHNRPELRSISSRAEITVNEFISEYEWEKAGK